MMKTPCKVLLVCMIAAAAAGGCRSSPKVTVVKDAGPAQRAKAMDLALEAQRAHNAGQHERALRLYQESLGFSQDLFMVWNNLGILLMEKGNLMNAAEMFKSAADLQPSDPRPYYNIGLIYQRAGYDEPALEYYVRSLERDPRYLPSLRGAVTVGKHLDISDEPAQSRVRSALLLETDPKWREIFERESLRIKGTLGRRETMVPVGASQKELESRWEQLRGRPRQEPMLAPEMVPEAPLENPVNQPLPEPAGGSEPPGGGQPSGGGVGSAQDPGPGE